jgi:hypothetical protein
MVQNSIIGDTNDVTAQGMENICQCYGLTASNGAEMPGIFRETSSHLEACVIISNMTGFHNRLQMSRLFRRLKRQVNDCMGQVSNLQISHLIGYRDPKLGVSRWNDPKFP